MLEFFLRAADAVDLPVYLYNFPELTGNRIGPETVRAFAERANMAGLKQSGLEFDYHKELIALANEYDFSIFSGSDARLPEVFKMGAHGCIGGMTNFVPELMIKIYRTFYEGLEADITEAEKHMQEAERIINQLTFPLNVACGLEARGLNPGQPKTVVSQKSLDKYAEVVEELKTRFSEWGIPQLNS